MRYIHSKVVANKVYDLEVETIIKYSKYVEMTALDKGVNFFYKFCDGKGVRQLSERYLPSNLQFDQFKREFKISFSPSFVDHEVISNASKSVDRYGVVHLEFPKYFNSASPYLHVFPKGMFKLHKFQINDVNVLLYFAKINLAYNNSYLLSKLKTSIQSIMDELADDFGEFPFKDLVIYMGENASGIEHAGATRTSRYSLRHELFHMYFGRGAMPVNGKSAWIDEGLARWSDGGSWDNIKRWTGGAEYFQLESLPEDYVGLPGRSEYMRSTWDYRNKLDPYAQGATFFSFLDYKMNGEFRGFLKEFSKKYFHKLYSQEDFFHELKKYVSNIGYMNFTSFEIDQLVEKYFN